MNDKIVKIPSADHPITITAHDGHVVVKAGGQIIADSHRAVSLKEASYPAVIYVPRADVNMALLERSDHATYCPYKGDCSYYSIPAGGEKSRNAVWTYEAAYPHVGEINEYLAFYPDRIDTAA